MAVTFLTATELASVRTLLGATAVDLPDATLTDAVVGGAAETEAMALVGDPVYTDRPEDEQAAIRRAATYLTAANALETTRSANAATSVKFSQQYARGRQPIDLDAWATSLRARGYGEIDELTPETSVSYFGVAAGRRGA